MVKKCLLSIHEDIKKTRDNLLMNKMELENYKEKLKLWELEEADNIANAVGENGKPLYSNETKRKAELERRKQSSNYMDMQKQLRDMQINYDRRVIELQSLLDRQENARALARLEEAR